jgi:hypothetical protein
VCVCVCPSALSMPSLVVVVVVGGGGGGGLVVVVVVVVVELPIIISDCWLINHFILK